MDKRYRNIETINYEAQQFLFAFQRFCGVNNFIDQSLCANLLNIVAEIENFLDKKPKEIPTSNEQQLTPLYLRKIGFRESLICGRCGVECDCLNNVRIHLLTDRHTKGGREWKARDPPKNNARNAKKDVQVLPKKAVSLIEGDISKFGTESFEIADKLTNLRAHNIIENDLLTLIRPAYPDLNIKIYMFGSRLSGMGNSYSDLDLFVDIGEVFNSFENKPSPGTKSKLMAVKKLIEKDANWSGLSSIDNARVPIIRVFHKPTSIKCDIGFSNSLGFCNTKLMKYLLGLQPLVKAMCLFMKKWLERTKLKGLVTTYSSNLMVVLYFQTKKLLPSIKLLQDGFEDSVTIGPWLAVFAEKSLADLNIPTASTSVKNFKAELKEFFEFYADFSFQTQLVCPYLGYVIPFENLETSPLFPSYVKYIETDKENKDLRLQKSCMNVQDPFQLNHNVTKGIPTPTVDLMKKYFKLSANLLANNSAQKETMTKNSTQ